MIGGLCKVLGGLLIVGKWGSFVWYCYWRIALFCKFVFVIWVKGLKRVL